MASRSAESWLTLVPRSAAISREPGVYGCVSANLDLLARTFVRLGHPVILPRKSLVPGTDTHLAGTAVKQEVVPGVTTNGRPRKGEAWPRAGTG